MTDNCSSVVFGRFEFEDGRQPVYVLQDGVTGDVFASPTTHARDGYVVVPVANAKGRGAAMMIARFAMTSTFKAAGITYRFTDYSA